MSLDMFMFKCDIKTYCSGDLDKKGLIKLCQKALEAGQNNCEDDSKLVFLEYWNGANQMYRWFLQHTDVEREHPGPYSIKREELYALKATCKDVLEFGRFEDGVEVLSVCKKLLPVLAGPCFGSIVYDEYYFCEVQLMYDFLCELLETTNWDEEVILLYAEW